MAETTGSASIDINASPEAVYGILTDLSRISELSPECYQAEWEGDSTGPEVGASYRGYNRAGDNEWDIAVNVVAAEPGRAWAFEVPSPDAPTQWAYAIEATDGGCRVTESFDAPVLAEERFQEMGRHQMLVANIETTLQNLKTAAES